MEKLIEEFSFGFFSGKPPFCRTFVLLQRCMETHFKLLKNAKTPLKIPSVCRKSKADMEAVQADNKRILKEARAERDALLLTLKASTQMINEAKEAAKAEADKIATAAQASIEQEKNAAINELKTK